MQFSLPIQQDCEQQAPHSRSRIFKMIPHNLAVLFFAAFQVQSFVPKFPDPPLTRLQVSMHNRRTTVDFYGVLEVSPHASADEIKRAYRKMAKRYHPGKIHQFCFCFGYF